VAEAASLTTNRNKGLHIKVDAAAAELQTDIQSLAVSRREDNKAVLVQIDGIYSSPPPQHILNPAVVRAALPSSTRDPGP